MSSKPNFWRTFSSVKGRTFKVGDTEITETYLDSLQDNIDSIEGDIGNIQETLETIQNPMLYKGAIDLPEDFPDADDVQNGWTYRISTDVTDNETGKTETNQEFLSGDEIAWNGTEWDVLGSAQNVSRTNIYYVDGGRTDTYTEDGSLMRPFKTILRCQDAINAITETLVADEDDYESAKFIVNIAPGTYEDNLTINSASGQAKYIRYNMEGVTISGDIDITQEQLGLTDYYSRVEFVGGFSTRGEKGKCGRITGDITFHKTAFDSLAYDSFYGIDFTGNIKYGAEALAGHGTWVLYLDKCSLRETSKSITTNFNAGGHCLLIEAYDSEIRCDLVGVIDLYTCHGTSFRNVDITPANGCTLYNCTFSGTVSIVAAKNLAVDANSYKSLHARTPTLTNITLVPLDGFLPGSTDFVTTLKIKPGGYYSADGSAGVTPANPITVAVGDTITIKDGIITAYTPFGA